MTELLENEHQRKIYDFISYNPGLHLTKIAEILEMKISEVEPTLQYLEKKRVIIVTKETGFERYYIDDSRIGERDKRTLEIRKKVYDLISQNPGLYLSKIAEILEISIPLTDYHLQYMMENKEIVAVKDEKGYYKRYYTAESSIEKEDKDALDLLRKKIPLKIVLFLLRNPHSQHKEIMRHLGISSSALSYHLNKLVSNGIAVVTPHGKQKGYLLKNKEEIIRTLKKNEFHIELHLAADDFKHLWEDFNY